METLMPRCRVSEIQGLLWLTGVVGDGRMGLPFFVLKNLLLRESLALREDKLGVSLCRWLRKTAGRESISV